MSYKYAIETLRFEWERVHSVSSRADELLDAIEVLRENESDEEDDYFAEEI